MAKLTTAKRKKLKTKTFGLVEKVKTNSGIKKVRKYPMPDKSHAANAKARATQQYNKGNLSLAEKKKIDTKANKILKKSPKKSVPKKK